MSASLIGRSGSSTFRLSTSAVVDVACGLALLFGIGTGALPSWGSKTRWNNLLVGLAVRLTAGSKRTYELTSSIVPRGTSFHRSVELEFPPIVFDRHVDGGAISQRHDRADARDRHQAPRR